jgi:hypothetical protein
MTTATSSLFDHAPPVEHPPRSDDLTLPAPAGWPAPPDSAAYHGLAGELVRQLAPHTEADPVAILSQLLVAFGAAAGRGAWFQVEATRHHPNEFLILVGDSAKARKGSSWDHVARVLDRADPSLAARTLTGLSSGEGLIWSVRDAAANDPGITDQRLLVIEPEFASVLKQTTRDINTLSPALRSAWDGRPLALLTRAAPARATRAHISVIGHITATELRHHTSTVELANGFLNRFLLIACRRVRLLPEGGQHDPLGNSPLQRRLARHLAGAQHAGQLRLDPAARELWWDAYARLSEPRDGPTGAITARAEAHTIRLALLYALIDNKREIGAAHLQAALALADYSARSASWALDATTTDRFTVEIHAALQHSPNGLTRTQLRDLYHRNQPTTRIDQALTTLAAAGKATRRRVVLTSGRPAELWTATPVPPPR